MGIAAIAQRGGHRAGVQRHLAHDIVDGGGGHAGLHQRRHGIEDLGREAPGLAHALEPGGPCSLIVPSRRTVSVSSTVT
jgi:hypothetical protein